MKEETKKFFKRNKADLIFHWLLLIWPLIQYGIFYLGVNLNSLALAFKSTSGGFTWDNFSFVFSDNMWPQVWQSIKTSVLFYVVTTIISVPLALLFAYYIFKKLWGGKLFRFFLFLPSIVSSIVIVVLFHKFVDTALWDMLEDFFGVTPPSTSLINNISRSSYVPIIAFNIWINFGVTTLIYSNKMGEISPEMIEAAQLDGASAWQEFFHIVVPCVYSTLSVFLVTGFATIFINQYNLFSFYGSSIGFDAGTFGYYIFAGVQDYAGKGQFDSVWFNRYAALSIVATAIVMPLTLIARKLVEKYGPSED